MIDEPSYFFTREMALETRLMPRGKMGKYEWRTSCIHVFLDGPKETILL